MKYIWLLVFLFSQVAWSVGEDIEEQIGFKEAPEFLSENACENSENPEVVDFEPHPIIDIASMTGIRFYYVKWLEQDYNSSDKACQERAALINTALMSLCDTFNTVDFTEECISNFKRLWSKYGPPLLSVLTEPSVFKGLRTATQKYETHYNVFIYLSGHNLGLTHNFQASIDTDNYHISIEEIKKYFPRETFLEEGIPKSSSVMDYSPKFPAFTPSEEQDQDLPALGLFNMEQVEEIWSPIEDKTVPKQYK